MSRRRLHIPKSPLPSPFAEEVRAMDRIAGSDDFNRRGEYGRTPLHFFSFGMAPDELKKVASLLARGADSSISDDQGRTPLHAAAHKNRTAIAKLLLVAGANPNAQDKDGWAPLHMAAWLNAARTTVLLVKSGADVNLRNASGQTPLHIAARYQAYEVAKILVKTTDLSIRDNDGRTVLHSACASWVDGISGTDFDIPRNASPAVVRLLLKHGARPDLTDSRNRTPIDVAFDEHGGKEIIEMVALAWVHFRWPTTRHSQRE